MFRIGRWVSVFAVVLGVSVAQAADKEPGGRLKLVEAVPRDELNSVVTAVVSPDGRFLYTSSWRQGIVTVFARDRETGRLELKQTITDADNLNGVTGLALSPDGRLAIATAFSSKTTLLYSRNPENGSLARLDLARDGEGGVRLGFPIDVAFAPDSKTVCVVDDNGLGDEGKGAVASFRIQDDKLVAAGIDEGRDGCYAGARGLAFHPDGKTLLVACNRAGTLVVADHDPASGRTSVRQVIRDEEGDVHGLAGAFGVVFSPDGRFAYVCAGRFQGDNALSAFRLGSDGRLVFLQEILNGQGELKDFEGGNHLGISPDGSNVYAAATRSGTIACFGRDRTSGKLTYLETIPDGAPAGENAAVAVAISPDGRFAYVPTEDKKAISVFRRETGR
jgi:6-phosphogluconolactonase (cycloisomerase 2 family)